MKKPLHIKKLVLPNIPYVFIALFATKLGQAWRLAPGTDFSGKALHLMEGFAAAFQSALPSFHPIDLCVGVAAALLIRLIVYVKGKNAKKFRKNLEYGSARWGKPEDIAPYVDPKFENNVILTQTERLMATIRSREISACLVLQAQSQLKALYKDNADTIIGNCDSSIFLGGKEPGTLKELNQALGKETIDTFNTGESRGREVSHSLNYQKLGKDLATVDELAVLDGGKCILQLRGVRPFLSDKYDITKHPNYKYLSDADKRNEFDIERFLSRRLKPKPDEVYDVYDIDASVMDAGETAGG